MTKRLRFLAPLVTTLVLAAGCGSDGASGERASASTDANELLRTTFENTGQIKSAVIDLSAKVDADASAGLGGPVSVTLKGPFQTQGEGKLAKFDFQGAVSGAGQNLSGGVTFTGEKAYLSVMGTTYEVSSLITSQFLAGYEEAMKQQKAQGGSSGLSLKELGIDAEKWLTDAKNEGETTVGDTEVIKITGTANVEQIVNDIDALSKKAASLNVPGAAGNIPQQLTPEQKQAATDAIKDIKIEVYTGAEDQILRRLTVNASVEADGSAATIAFDLQFTDVNEDQDIEEPENAKPFSDLVKLMDESGFGDLAGLGAFGGGSGASGSVTEDGSSPEAVPTMDPEALNNVDKYADCIEQAAGDADKARECADLLIGG